MAMTEPPRTPQTNEEMSKRTKRLLLDSATSLFSERGYTDTTILDITEAAGLTKGALYHHFSSKEEILLRIFEDMRDRIVEESRMVLADDPPPIDALTGLIRAHARMATTYQEGILVILRERKMFTSAHWELIRQRRAEIEAMFTGVIEEGQRTGDFALIGEPRLVTRAILGMINWSSEWYRVERDDPDEIAEIFVDLVLPSLVHGPLPE